MVWKTYRKTATVRAHVLTERIEIATREGIMVGNPGDYVCEGIEGEHWPVKKEIFERTYELVE